MAQREAGNVLFLVLIAVSLFATLSYAVTKSTSGGGNIDRELAGIRASQILQWYSLVQGQATRMSVRQGIGSASVKLADGNSWTACMTGTDCLWSTDGGGVEYPPAAIRSLFNGWTDSFADSNVGSSNVPGFKNATFFLIYLGTDAQSAETCKAYQYSVGLGYEIPAAGSTTHPGQRTQCYLHSSGNYAMYFVVGDEG